MQNRMDQFKQILQKEQVDAAVITSTENVFYFTQFFSNPHERLLAVFLFPEHDPFLICPAMEVHDAKKSGFAYEICGYSDIENPWKIIHKELQKRHISIKRIGIEKLHMNVERFEHIRTLFPHAEFASLEGWINEIRMIKDKDEWLKIKKACELADFAIEVGMNEIKEGKTELELVAAIEFELKKKGVEQMSFSTTVLAGSNAASPHGKPGNTPIMHGDFVLFDLGVVYEGYCSDITRTIAYSHVSDEQRTVYETVLAAQVAAVNAVKDGLSCEELDLTARNIIQQAGYGEYFPHRLGHGLGISVHEYPSITETNPLILKKGMVFTIEPGIYIPNKVGVRIEDDIIVTENGCEVLTKFPKELIIVS